MDKQPVIFRKGTKDKEVMAIFPDTFADMKGNFLCYQHIGQHGACCYAYYLDKTRPAQEAEYRELYQELKDIGYVLKVVKKVSARHLSSGREALRGMEEGVT